jgi:hypothetical protein
MARLMVRCPSTTGVSFTGLVMDEASFLRCDFPFDGTAHVCPFCAEVHSYRSADFFLAEDDHRADTDVAAE